jgi:hypothetical protein
LGDEPFRCFQAKSKAIKPPADEPEVFLPAGPGPINPVIYRGARNIRVKPPAAKPKTIEEVLAQVEHEGGIEGRKAFEGFLKKMVKIKEEQAG